MPLTYPRHRRHRPSLEELRARFANRPAEVELRPRRRTLTEVRAQQKARAAGRPAPVLDLYDHLDPAVREAARQARRDTVRRLVKEMEAEEIAGAGRPEPAFAQAEPDSRQRAYSVPRDPDRTACEVHPAFGTRENSQTCRPVPAVVNEGTDGVPPHLRIYKRTPLQINLGAWLDEVKWNLMVTLTFRHPDGVSKALAEKIFGRFLKKLRAILIRKGTNNKIPMAAVVEDSREQLRELGLSIDGREGTHIHFLTRVRGGEDPYKYKEAIRLAWIATNRLCGEPRVYCPNSDKWFLPLTSDEMRRGFTGYVLKHHGHDTLGLLIQYLHFD